MFCHHFDLNSLFKIGHARSITFWIGVANRGRAPLVSSEKEGHHYVSPS
jgi:hypothetical protein